MRSVGLDLGARHIAFCEVRDGQVVDRASVKSLDQLRSRLGANVPAARVAFEASREAWHVHDKLAEWGHEPWMLDTTRARSIGIGHHKRKNDAIDAEVIARAVESGRVPRAHVLSPARRALRAELSVRGALVSTRSQYVSTIRGLLRAAGVEAPKCAAENFSTRLRDTQLPEATRALVGPLAAVLDGLDRELVAAEAALVATAEREPAVCLLATMPGVGLIVAATFVSVIDDAGRFANAQSVGAYLGLVPSESTTGGPDKRRLGSITKQGNTLARTMLVQAAWLILRSHRGEDPLRAWGLRVSRKRGKCIAAIALARKLAGVLWAMWRDGKPYDPARQAASSVKGMRADAATTALEAAVIERAARKLRRRASRSTKTSEANVM